MRGLVARGVPIHGVGLQMHLRAGDPPPPGRIRANMRRLAALGLRVEISEMDVQVRMLRSDRPARLAAQRRVYRDVVGACVAEPGCHAVTFWGVGDAHSWIDGDAPLLFDESLAPKPAYFGVLDGLQLGRRDFTPASAPPSTRSSAPVVKDDSSEARKSTARETSSVRAPRPIG